jgi:hypothetical protein
MSANVSRGPVSRSRMRNAGRRILTVAAAVVFVAGAVAVAPAPAAAAQKIGRVGPGWLKVICDLLGGTYNDYPGTGLYECLLPGGPWVMCDPTDCHIVRTEPPREDVVIRTEYGLYIVPADGGPITFPAVPDPDRTG